MYFSFSACFALGVLGFFSLAVNVGLAAYVGPSHIDKSIPSIAVIGAGLSGMNAWKFFTDHGLKTTVYEAKDRVGGHVETAEIDGKYYDLATLWIPKGSIGGYGKNARTTSLIQDLIDLAGAEIEDAVSPVSAQGTEFSAVFAPLQQFDLELLSEQLIKQYAFYACNLTLECGFVDVNDAASIFQIPAMQVLSSYVAETLSGGFGGTRGQLPFEANWVPAYTAYVLQAIGKTLESLPKYTPLSLRSFFVAGNLRTPLFRFTFGYGHFLKSLANALASRESSTLLLEAKVTALLYFPETSNWEMTYQIGPRQYTKTHTHVIIASSPKDTLSYLPEGRQNDLRALLAARQPIVPITTVFMTHATYPSVWDGRSLFAVPAERDVTSPEFDTSCGLTNVKQYTTTDVLYVGVVTVGPVDVDKIYEVCRQSLERSLGVKLGGTYIETRQFNWPFTPSSVLDWNKQLATLQGKNNLFVIGEAVSNAGLPAISFYVNNLLGSAFESQKLAGLSPDL
jgi:Flavin containing amine oxidoreductase